MNIQKQHNEKIIEQFSKQAVPFTTIEGHYDSVDTIISMCELKSYHKVLDIACGTGIVTCEFAKHAKEVIGLDITEGMLNQARKLQKEKELNNINFRNSNVEVLPFEDNSFDIVFTRYSFHHFLDTQKVFDEMLRVCKKDGKIIIVDVSLKQSVSLAYNQMEKLRDPSHTKALTFEEFNNLFDNSELKNHKESSYKVNLELEKQLEASFPNKGDEDKIRKIFQEDIKTNALGVESYKKDGKIYFSYPISIFLAQKK
ncbi:class I SAM-dependent methyltransferase [Poseidonibacter lekithochrous]|uniref:class I SAM-dependent methyltransferase n=1 Tax=Poseidonibacter lekithochrous TaxID=1904463 RepID=UPI0008FC8A7F|nr:methyltransferase domain-containing protein [Poseidonibacter lekithochrous]QKJ23196.1 methyltransferase [Poseidonibacter lekithochrous]